MKNKIINIANQFESQRNIKNSKLSAGKKTQEHNATKLFETVKKRMK